MVEHESRLRAGRECARQVAVDSSCDFAGGKAKNRVVGLQVFHLMQRNFLEKSAACEQPKQQW